MIRRLVLAFTLLAALALMIGPVLTTNGAAQASGEHIQKATLTVY